MTRVKKHVNGWSWNGTTDEEIELLADEIAVSNLKVDATPPWKFVPLAESLRPKKYPCAICSYYFTRDNLPGLTLKKTISQLRAMWGKPAIDKRDTLGGVRYDKQMVCSMCMQYPEMLLLDPSVRRRTSVMVDAVGMSIKVSIAPQVQSMKSPKRLEMVSDLKECFASSVLDNPPSQAVNKEIFQPRKDCFRSCVQYQPWWEVDLGNHTIIKSIRVNVPLKGKDGVFPNLRFIIFLSIERLELTPKDRREGVMELEMGKRDCEAFQLLEFHREMVTWQLKEAVVARYVRVQLVATAALVLRQVQVCGVADSAAEVANLKSTSQDPPSEEIKSSPTNQMQISMYDNRKQSSVDLRDKLSALRLSMDPRSYSEDDFASHSMKPATLSKNILPSKNRSSRIPNSMLMRLGTSPSKYDSTRMVLDGVTNMFVCMAEQYDIDDYTEVRVNNLLSRFSREEGKTLLDFYRATILTKMSLRKDQHSLHKKQAANAGDKQQPVVTITGDDNGDEAMRLLSPTGESFPNASRPGTRESKSSSSSAFITSVPSFDASTTESRSHTPIQDGKGGGRVMFMTTALVADMRKQFEELDIERTKLISPKDFLLIVGLLLNSNVNDAERLETLVHHYSTSSDLIKYYDFISDLQDFALSQEKLAAQVNRKRTVSRESYKPPAVVTPIVLSKEEELAVFENQQREKEAANVFKIVVKYDHVLSSLYYRKSSAFKFARNSPSLLAIAQPNILDELVEQMEIKKSFDKIVSVCDFLEFVVRNRIACMDCSCENFLRTANDRLLCTCTHSWKNHKKMDPVDDLKEMFSADDHQPVEIITEYIKREERLAKPILSSTPEFIRHKKRLVEKVSPDGIFREGAIIRAKCGLCEFEYRDDCMTQKVTQKAIWDIRATWGMEYEAAKIKSASRMYQGVRICLFCSQFFSYDIDKAFLSIRGNELGPGSKAPLKEDEEWNGRIVDEGIATPSMRTYSTTKLTPLKDRFSSMSHLDYFKNNNPIKPKDDGKFKPHGLLGLDGRPVSEDPTFKVTNIRKRPLTSTKSSDRSATATTDSPSRDIDTAASGGTFRGFTAAKEELRAESPLRSFTASSDATRLFTAERDSDTPPVRDSTASSEILARPFTTSSSSRPTTVQSAQRQSRPRPTGTPLLPTSTHYEKEGAFDNDLDVINDADSGMVSKQDDVVDDVNEEFGADSSKGNTRSDIVVDAMAAADGVLKKNKGKVAKLPSTITDEYNKLKPVDKKKTSSRGAKAKNSSSGNVAGLKGAQPALAQSDAVEKILRVHIDKDITVGNLLREVGLELQSVEASGDPYDVMLWKLQSLKEKQETIACVRIQKAWRGLLSRRLMKKSLGSATRSLMDGIEAFKQRKAQAALEKELRRGVVPDEVDFNEYQR